MINHKKTKRAKLRRLVVLHPDWTYSQFALELEQSVDTVRGAFGAMKLPRPPREGNQLLKRWDGTFVKRKEQWKQAENM